MRFASPAFQPDRDGLGGFQLAEDGGFQTQTPAWIGNASVVLNGTSPTALSVYAPHHAYVGDARVVVAASAITHGPRPSFGGGVIWTMPLHWRVEGDARVVVAASARTAFRRGRAPRALRPAAQRHTVQGCASAAIASTARCRFHDYVREVVLPDDEDVLVLLMGGR